MAQSAQQLRLLQRQTLDAIRRPLTRDFTMISVLPDGAPVAPIIERLIKPNDRLSSFERLEIYNKQYWFRLLDCLWDDYPGLRTVLGERKFQRLCVAYLNKYPSRHFSLRNLGSRLEQFLTEEPHWASPYENLALDLARFEWAQVIAFDEAQKPVLTPTDLAGRDPATLKLALQPHITLLELGYPLDDFVIAVKRQAMRGDASNAMAGKRKKHSNKPISRPRRQRVFIAVYRQNNMIYYKRLSEAEYKIICALRDGKTIARACALPDASPEQISQWFAQWAQLGWFVGTEGEKRVKGKKERRVSNA